MRIERLFQVTLVSFTLALSSDVVKTGLATGHKQNQSQLVQMTQVAQAPSVVQVSQKSSIDSVMEIVLISLVLTFGLAAIKQMRK